MSQRIVRKDHDGLCALTLNRPEKLNALDGAFFDELDEIAQALSQQTGDIGCVVVRASGRAFCAGADLAGVGVEQRDQRLNTKILERFSNLPQPIIAGVHGICYTGGLELALACDFIIAGSDSRFADTHGKWGFVSNWGMTQRLPRRIGEPAAKLLMMTGLPIDAGRALEIGLIDEVCQEGQLDRAVAGLAGSILENSWFTNASVKRLIRQTRAMPLDQGLAHEAHNWPGSAPDSRERVAKFTKRN